jgi:hypothetical protein
MIRLGSQGRCHVLVNSRQLPQSCVHVGCQCARESGPPSMRACLSMTMSGPCPSRERRLRVCPGVRFRKTPRATVSVCEISENAARHGPVPV